MSNLCRKEAHAKNQISKDETTCLWLLCPSGWGRMAGLARISPLFSWGAREWVSDSILHANLKQTRSV